MSSRVIQLVQQHVPTFISHMCDTFWPTISAIIRRYYKNKKGRTDKTEEEASPLQYYSIKRMSEHLFCCISPINTEDINLINTTG